MSPVKKILKEIYPAVRPYVPYTPFLFLFWKTRILNYTYETLSTFLRKKCRMDGTGWTDVRTILFLYVSTHCTPHFYFYFGKRGHYLITCVHVHVSQNKMLFDIGGVFLRLRGTVPPPCRRSAFYVAVEAENGCYTWLRLRASRGLPRRLPRPSALRIACTFRAHSAPSANRGTFRNFRAWPSMTRPTE